MRDEKHVSLFLSTVLLYSTNVARFKSVSEHQRCLRDKVNSLYQDPDKEDVHTHHQVPVLLKQDRNSWKNESAEWQLCIFMRRSHNSELWYSWKSLIGSLNNFLATQRFERCIFFKVVWQWWCRMSQDGCGSILKTEFKRGINPFHFRGWKT